MQYYTCSQMGLVASQPRLLRNRSAAAVVTVPVGYFSRRFRQVCRPTARSVTRGTRRSCHQSGKITETRSGGHGYESIFALGCLNVLITMDYTIAYFLPIHIIEFRIRPRSVLLSVSLVSMLQQWLEGNQTALALQPQVEYNTANGAGV